MYVCIYALTSGLFWKIRDLISSDLEFTILITSRIMYMGPLKPSLKYSTYRQCIRVDAGIVASLQIVSSYNFLFVM